MCAGIPVSESGGEAHKEVVGWQQYVRGGRAGVPTVPLEKGVCALLWQSCAALAKICSSGSGFSFSGFFCKLDRKRKGGFVKGRFWRMYPRSGFWGTGLSKIIVFLPGYLFRAKGLDEWLTGMHERIASSI